MAEQGASEESLRGRPLLVVAHQDEVTLAALVPELEGAFGEQAEVVATGDEDGALRLLGEAQQAQRPVALIIASVRLPPEGGFALLGRSTDLAPDARRVLLTRREDLDVVLEAATSAKIDHYIIEPWGDPHQHLLPATADLLESWRACVKPAQPRVEVIGHRWSSLGHELRDFLARNLIPYRWRDVERERVPEALLSDDGHALELPVVVLPDGRRLSRPSPIDLAGELGMQTSAEETFYDLVVVGAGPAGLASGVYAGSEGLRTVLVEREAPGGQAGTSSRIENYLGFPSGVTGAELAARAAVQAARFGVEILTPQTATGLRIVDSYRIVTLADGQELHCYAVVLAVGVTYRLLDAEGADRLTGKGIYYGASLVEAAVCSGTDVFIVGAANSAGQAAVFFSRHARSVTVLVRGESLEASMSAYLVERIRETPTIHVATGTRVVAAQGEDHLEAIEIERADGSRETLPAAALFVFIGAKPRTDWLPPEVLRDEEGLLLTGPDLLEDGRPPSGWPLERPPHMLETSVPGVFAAGDVRSGAVRRVASAVGEGAMALSLVHRYLDEGYVRLGP